MMAPTTAPAAAPTPAPRFALAFGSFGSVEAQAVTRRAVRMSVEALGITGPPLRVARYESRNPQRATRNGRRALLSEAPFAGLLRRVGPDVNLHAPVELTSAGRVVGGAGLRLAVADRVDARAADAELLEVSGHAVRAPFREPLVIRRGADRVGVSRHFDGGVRVLVEHAGHL